MTCYSGFGNLLDGEHPMWLGDFTGAGHVQFMFHYVGDGNWWLGDMAGGQLQWSLAGNTAGFGNLLDGAHPMWLGDFTGVGHLQFMFQYVGDGNWWLGDMAGGQLQWSFVGNTAGFGNLLDGAHPMWLGDFTGAGHLQFMFHYVGDGNWWLGDMAGGQLQWSFAGNTAGFGNLLDGAHPMWLGDFTGAGHVQFMFHYVGDGNWWLGDMAGGQLQWSFAGNTAGFGNLLDGAHPMWLGDFTGAGHVQFMFHYVGDGNWWLGDMAGGQLQWSSVGNTAGFGNLLDGAHPMWLGDFTGAGHVQFMFNYVGDGNWWLGDMAGGQLQWSSVGNTAGFGNLLDGAHPMWLGDFTGVGHVQFMFHYVGDGNWWLGDMAGGQLQWSFVGNTAGFGNLLDGAHPMWLGDFTGVGHVQFMFYYVGDGNWWLGDMAGGQLQWSFVDNTGRPCSQFIRVHFKSLLSITNNISNFIASQFAEMEELYSQSGIAAYFGTTEDLSGNATLAALANFNVGNCIGGVVTADHTTLFPNRNNAGTDDIVVYIAQTLIGGAGNFLGCAVHPATQPGAVIVQSAARWLTAHEVGHVLGLAHVCQFPTATNPTPPNPCTAVSSDSLMFPNVGWTNVPPDISQAEAQTMLNSALTAQLLIGGIAMAMSYDEVRSQLSDIEPSEATYAGITEAEIPHLQRMIETEEPWLAARAVFALSRLHDEAAAPILRAAVQNPNVEVRVALAASAERMRPVLADELLTPLLDDPEVGVRRFAIGSVTNQNSLQLQNKVRDLAQDDSTPILRASAQQKLLDLR